MPRHLTFANVASALALTVALASGGAWAATQLPENSVASKQIKNESVTGKDVKDGSLLATDFGSGQLPAGSQGPQGPQGLPGAPGQPGTPGTPAVSLFAAVVDTDDTSAATLGPNKGALSVADPAGANTFLSPYVVTFNRDLTGCVATATIGRSGNAGGALIGEIYVDVAATTIKAFSMSGGGAFQDASLMVAVFC